jgi:two-component system, OmpR family, alkaline phosphatase synthesis response regulator PhoP
VVAEHDNNLNLRMASALRQEGFDVYFATNGSDALRLIYEEKPDFIILESMIPPMGGMRILRWIQTEPSIAGVPIIMLSAKENDTDRMLAFDVGVDDYLSTPFEMNDLLARINTLYRSRTPRGEAGVLKAGDIEMYLNRWEVFVAGKPVNLTVKEYRLLQELLEAEGSVLSRDTLLERVWGYDKGLNIHTRTVDVHMSRLRNKLGASGNFIITIRNIGYRIDIMPVRH